jgi:acyl-homoserine-lactone acylase
LWRVGANRAPDLWRVPFDPKHPATTPSTLNSDSTGVRQALAEAVQGMADLGVPLDAPLSAAQQTTVGGPAVPVPGCTGAEGCYNVVGRADPLGADGRFAPVTFGSSFVMATELTAAGPRTSTLLTYSESADPTSPHHNDQTVLFSRKQWVAERYSEDQIRRSPQLRTAVVTGR